MSYRVTPQARREFDAALEFQANEWGREAVHALDFAFEQVFVIVRILHAQMEPKRAMRKTEPWS